jgi:hypothetical protein
VGTDNTAADKVKIADERTESVQPIVGSETDSSLVDKKAEAIVGSD